MSLTRELKTNKKLFKTIIENVNIEMNAVLKKRSENKYPLKTKSNYLEISAIVGTAYDYMLRFEILKRNTNKENLFNKYKEKLVSNYGFFNIQSNNIYDSNIEILYSSSLSIIDQFINNKNKIILEDYISSLIVITLFEQNYRNKNLSIVKVLENKDYKKYIKREYKYVISDLKNLYSSFENNEILKNIEYSKEVILNPYFSNSKKLNGADCDLIVDQTMIDIKTIQSCNLTEDMLSQLIGYYILAINDGVKLNKIAIYFSRYDYLYLINIDDIMTFENINNIDNQFKNDYMFKKNNIENFEKNIYKVKIKEIKESEDEFEFSSY